MTDRGSRPSDSVNLTIRPVTVRASARPAPGRLAGYAARWTDRWARHIREEQAIPVIFKWNPQKAALNLKKHGVDFHEAATVLDDPLSTTFPDPEHSRLEQRYLTIGMSAAHRLLVVVHTEEGEVVRIISARCSTASERKYYEEG